MILSYLVPVDGIRDQELNTYVERVHELPKAGVLHPSGQSP